jgi:tight adherence protein B
MDYLFYLFATLIFIAVVLLIEGIYISWNSSKGPEAERAARRLRIMSAGEHSGDQSISIVKERLLSKTPAMQRFLLQMPRVAGLDRLLLQSGLPWTVADFLTIVLVAFFVPFIVSSYFAVSWPIQLALAGFFATLPVLYVTRAKGKRLARIEQQLPDALDLMGRALRAGHAFPTALKMVGDEMNDPLAAEFRAAFDEVNFGIAMQDALMNLATRVPSTDLRYFVIAVLIQRETGGNLSELLTSISTIIRDRIKLLGQVRVLSAEGKMSAWVLSLLPFGAAAMIQLTNPQFLELLYTDPAGRKMLAVAGILMVIGIFIMRQIVRIRV